MMTKAEAKPIFPKESQTRTFTSYFPTYAIEPSPMRPNQENFPGRFEPLYSKIAAGQRPSGSEMVMRAPAIDNEPGLNDTLAEPKSNQSGVIEALGAWLPTTKVTLAVCSRLPALSEARTSIVYVPFVRRLFQSSDHAPPESGGRGCQVVPPSSEISAPETPEVGTTYLLRFH